jgi:hypothetical protein
LVGPRAAAAAPGDILVVDTGASGVIRVDPVTGARTTVSENSAPPGGPAFVNPVGVALEADGDILVADGDAFGGGGGVIRVDAVRGARTTVSENAAPPGGPAFLDPEGVALEADGDILVADVNAFGGAGRVIRVDPLTGARTTVSENSAPPGGPAFLDPVGVALEADGDILVADAGAFGGEGGVIRVDPLTGARTTVSENSAPPRGPAFDDPFGVAVVPPAPVAMTGEAREVTGEAATLGGSVNPQGLAAEYRFEYGPTTAYGASTPAAALDAGRTPVAVEARVSGLSGATTYHYRLVATTASGTTTGADRTFQTTAPGPPPPPAAAAAIAPPAPPPPLLRARSCSPTSPPRGAACAWAAWRASPTPASRSRSAPAPGSWRAPPCAPTAPSRRAPRGPAAPTRRAPATGRSSPARPHRRSSSPAG